jgi:carboxymethylenebutenolidase
MQNVRVESSDGAGAFDVSLALPASPSAPGLVIVPHIGGATQDMLDIAEHFAGLGFVAAIPDVFWRVGPGPAPRTDEGRKWSRERAERVDVDRCVEDIAATIAAVNALPASNGRCGVIGYCFGGRYAFLAATRLGVEYAGSFHGVNIGAHLNEAAAVAGSLSFHFGDSDPIVPMAEVDAIRTALGSRPRVEIAVYPGAQHNFTALGRDTYDPVAARTSEEHVLAMLRPLFA